MNNQLQAENGIVILSNNTVRCLGGKQREFGRILSDLGTEIEKLKKIRSRLLGDSDQSLTTCSHR